MKSEREAIVCDAPEGYEFRIVGNWPHGRNSGTSPEYSPVDGWDQEAPPGRVRPPEPSRKTQ